MANTRSEVGKKTQSDSIFSRRLSPIGQESVGEGMSEAEANALVKDAEKACVNSVSLSALFSLLLSDITFRFIFVTSTSHVSHHATHFARLSSFLSAILFSIGEHPLV